MVENHREIHVGGDLRSLVRPPGPSRISNSFGPLSHYSVSAGAQCLHQLESGHCCICSKIHDAALSQTGINTSGLSLPSLTAFCGSCAFRRRSRFMRTARTRKGGASGPGHVAVLCEREAHLCVRKTLEETSGNHVSCLLQSRSSLIQ